MAEPWKLLGKPEVFSAHVEVFKRKPPFTLEQLWPHREAITRRRELGSTHEALEDEVFLHAAYDTLEKWGMESRGAQLVEYGAFCSSLASHASEIAGLEKVRIEERFRVADVSAKLWKITVGAA